jgi:HEAT repeat protein
VGRRATPRCRRRPALPLLNPMLADPDREVRCTACEAVLLVDAQRAMDLVLHLLDDPDVTVRWHACGCLHDHGDERAVAALVKVLRGDPDAQVRGSAASALGGIGSPGAIPALLAAIDSDDKEDIHGHSAASCAASALDDILGTEETRIKVTEMICRVRPEAPDMGRLRRHAEERYQQWSRRRDE